MFQNVPWYMLYYSTTTILSLRRIIRSNCLKFKQISFPNEEENEFHLKVRTEESLPFFLPNEET